MRIKNEEGREEGKRRKTEAKVTLAEFYTQSRSPQFRNIIESYYCVQLVLSTCLILHLVVCRDRMPHNFVEKQRHNKITLRQKHNLSSVERGQSKYYSSIKEIAISANNRLQTKTEAYVRNYAEKEHRGQYLHSRYNLIMKSSVTLHRKMKNTLSPVCDKVNCNIAR